MDYDLLLAKISRKLNSWLEPWCLPRRLRFLQWLNETGIERIVEPGGPIVSLTTYGPRLNSVHLTIESIGCGRRKPSRLILWLDDERRFKDLPDGVRRLQTRGLEVCLAPNLGPHTKYYPYVASLSVHTVPLVTADDDIIYPRQWLDSLWRAYVTEPSKINCYRAHVVALGSIPPKVIPQSTETSPLEGGGQDSGRLVILPYRVWPPCQSRESSWRHFATGVSGVIYPPRFLEFLRAQGLGFKNCCPKADDVWLHAMALRAGMRIRQIGRLPRHFPVVPDTQVQGLVHFNSFNGGNDHQISETYVESDLEKMAGGG